MEEFVMHKKISLAGIIVILSAALLLAACSGSKSPAAPTGDANAVYTQAAATVSAGLTQTAAKNPAPSATPAPPTATATTESKAPTPTIEQPGPSNQATATKTPAGGIQPTATKAAGTQPTATKAAGTQPTATKSSLIPTATKAAAPPPATGDKGLWVSQSPVDKTKIQKSATFTMTYVIKNTGTTTWTTKYALRFYAGSQMSGPNDTNLIKDVPPGESAVITFTMVAPDTAGNTSTVWVLTNADGANFYSVNLDLAITD
jgi:hypothetical protein